MLHFLTAGESHGPALVTILEGMVAGVQVSDKEIKAELQRRRHGYGRGTRMKFEEDRLDILGGVRHGRTIGSPVAMVIHNTEWPKWQQIMAVGEEDAIVEDPPLSRPRPGHADLPGMTKYGFDDARNILERASARETAARVAIGAVCKAFLRPLGIEVLSHVVSIGHVASSEARLPAPADLETIDASALRCLDVDAEQQMITLIEDMRRNGDTLGGVFEVLAYGVPTGLGSHVHWERRMDASIAQALMSIQAVKGVEIGPGFDVAAAPGSRAHDEITWTDTQGFTRPTDRSGGTEGGITTGQVLRARAAMKPLSSLARSLPTVDVRTKEPAPAITQRSDVCAVPAAGVVGESMLAFVLARAVLEKFGGDSLEETVRNLDAYPRRNDLMPGNVVLIGFMGAGKSTVGRALAERLHYRYFDTDDMIVTRAGMTVADIWTAEGEKGFRDREHDAVLHACAGAGRVIACGGGAVLELRNYGILKGSGTVVYLRAPADVLRRHVGDGSGRPLLADEGAFDRLLSARTPAYESAADLIVDVDAGTPDEIAQTIMEKLT